MSLSCQAKALSFYRWPILALSNDRQLNISRQKRSRTPMIQESEKNKEKKKKEENFLITLFYFLLSFVNARTVFNSDIVQILFVMWPFLRQIRRMAKSHSQNMLVEWDFFSRRLTNSPETIDTAVIGNIQIFPIVCRYCK